MSLAADRIRAETLSKIQDTLIMMDFKIANLIHSDSVPGDFQPAETRIRMERTAIALDEIRENVRQAYGEEAKVSSRLVQLWLEIRAKAMASCKASALRPGNLRVIKR